MIADSCQKINYALFISEMNVDRNLDYYIMIRGARGVVVVKALRYKPVGRGFDSRWCHWNFSVT